MPTPEESQLKLHLRTTLSKLQYKLNKSRVLSTQTLQTKVVPSLKDLSTLSTPPTDENPEPQQSRQFERSLELVRVQIGEMVRRDRHADVWEDLIGELGLLDGSIGRISGMIDEVLQRENDKKEQLKEAHAKKKSAIASSKNDTSSGSIWGFWKKAEPREDVEQEEETPKREEENEFVASYNPLLLENQDRYTKIIRNAIVAEWFIGDEIKELRKLKIVLSHCVDKELLNLCTSKDGINTLENTLKSWYKAELNKIGNDNELEVSAKQMDLEDKTLIEIIRKLRGDDEVNVIDDYLAEIVDIYRIDLYSTGKYEEEEEEIEEEDDDEDKDDSNEQGKDNSVDGKSDSSDIKDKKYTSDKKSSTDKKSIKPKPLDSKKKLNDLDELKKRFNDLKRL